MARGVLRRVNVVGTSGSGKTMFSRKLAEGLGVACIEMDALFWGKNWEWPGDEEFFPQLEAALEQDRWVLDGNYGRTTAIKWRNVDTVIWLDFSFSRTMYQVTKRAMVRSLTRRELWPGTGNKESFRRAIFSRESIIRWAFKTYRGNRRRYTAARADDTYAHINFIRLKSPKECTAYLNGLRRSGHA